VEEKEGKPTYLKVQASYRDYLEVSGYHTSSILNLEIKRR
jgi:hypothetical protein